MNLQYKKIYIFVIILLLHTSTLLVSITNNFGTFPKKTVNTRLESKLILAKCRKSLNCLENTSHNIFQKNLKMYLLLWKLAIFLCQL